MLRLIGSAEARGSAAPSRNASARTIGTRPDFLLAVAHRDMLGLLCHQGSIDLEQVRQSFPIRPWRFRKSTKKPEFRSLIPQSSPPSHRVPAVIEGCLRARTGMPQGAAGAASE